jgi:hypothetical protein
MICHSWHHLLYNTPHFQHFTHIIIFSDGASKHFKSRFTMKFVADISIEAGRSMVYNFFASYHGSGLWDAHFAKNNAAIRNFLIHMEGLRKKCESKDFSPLGELKALARTLLAALDNTVVYEFCNINRESSLKPSVKPIPHIKQYHCFQLVDANHVDCCIMCGDAFPSIPIQFQPSSGSATVEDDEDIDGKEKEKGRKHTVSNMMEDNGNLKLDVHVDVDDEKEDIHVVPPAEPAPPSSSPTTSSSSTTTTTTSSRRFSKRQRTSRSTFTSSYGTEYYDIDDIDLD